MGFSRVESGTGTTRQWRSIHSQTEPGQQTISKPWANHESSLKITEEIR